MSSLTEEAIERLTFYMERLAWGEDRAKMLAERRQAMLAAGVPPKVIEAEFLESDPDADAPRGGSEASASAAENGAGPAPSMDDENW